MADPVASIITLATVSLAIIRKTNKFIEEAKEIDTSIRRLHDKLRDLETTITLVEKTCENATATDENPSQHIEKILKRCRRCLQRVMTLVESLAERQTRTLFHKNSHNYQIQSIAATSGFRNTGLN